MVDSTQTITKQDIGLGNVPNYGVASLPEAVDSRITDKLIVPNSLNHAIDTRLVKANLDDPGIIKINNGIYEGDDIDHIKALSSQGLLNLIRNTSTVFNAVQKEILALSKKNVYKTKEVFGTENNIILSIEPSVPTSQLYGIITFKAKFTNTGPVTLSTGNSPLPITYWNSQSLVAGDLVSNEVYAVLCSDGCFILLNKADNKLMSEKLNSLYESFKNLVNSNDPFPSYAKEEEVVNLLNTGFKGSYVGNAVLNNDTYTVTLPSSVTSLGIFAVRFNLPNPEFAILNINDMSKNIVMPNGAPIKENEIKQGEVRIIINIGSKYIIHPLSDIGDSLEAHTQAEDPHNQYWNDTRGNAEIATAISNHINESHQLASPGNNGMMSKEDKITLDNLEYSYHILTDMAYDGTNLIDLWFWKNGAVESPSPLAAFKWVSGSKVNSFQTRLDYRGISDVQLVSKPGSGGVVTGDRDAGIEGLKTRMMLDTNYTYRASIPFRIVSFTTGSVFFGCSEVCVLNSSTFTSAPIFAAVDMSLLEPNVDYFLVGYLFPYNLSNATHDGAGVYRADNGLKVENIAIARNYTLFVNSRTITFNTYLQNSSLGTECIFGKPLLQLVNGSETRLLGNKSNIEADLSDTVINLGTL